MKTLCVPFAELSESHQQECLRGYLWGCACGESHSTAISAQRCKKCRTYLEHSPTHIYFTLPIIKRDLDQKFNKLVRYWDKAGDANEQ